jgi:hypothetical protein
LISRKQNEKWRQQPTGIAEDWMRKITDVKKGVGQSRDNVEIAFTGHLFG